MLSRLLLLLNYKNTQHPHYCILAADDPTADETVDFPSREEPFRSER